MIYKVAKHYREQLKQPKVRYNIAKHYREQLKQLNMIYKVSKTLEGTTKTTKNGLHNIKNITGNKKNNSK